MKKKHLIIPSASIIAALALILPLAVSQEIDKTDGSAATPSVVRQAD